MITTDLDHSKKLFELAKEKGIKLPFAEHRWEQMSETQWNVHNWEQTRMDFQYPAYTLDELLEFLPKTIRDKGGFDYDLSLTWDYDSWRIGYDIDEYSFEDFNLCNACCDLLIWLIEGGYIK
jgi:hypothetical protein